MKSTTELMMVLNLAAMLLIGCGAVKGDREEKIGKPLTELQKKKIERTMSDMRIIGLAVKNYQQDHRDQVPDANSLPALKVMLEPTYIKVMPKNDKWGAEFRYEGAGEGFFIRSPGPDKMPDTGDDLELKDFKFTKSPRM